MTVKIDTVMTVKIDTVMTVKIDTVMTVKIDTVMTNFGRVWVKSAQKGQIMRKMVWQP